MSKSKAAGLQTSGNDIADTLADQIASSFTVGTDAEEYDHHYYRGADCVVVYDGREVDHVEWLDGRLLAEWVAYVAHERGWMGPGPHKDLGVKRDRQRKTEGED